MYKYIYAHFREHYNIIFARAADHTPRKVELHRILGQNGRRTYHYVLHITVWRSRRKEGAVEKKLLRPTNKRTRIGGNQGSSAPSRTYCISAGRDYYYSQLTFLSSSVHTAETMFVFFSQRLCMLWLPT